MDPTVSPINSETLLRQAEFESLKRIISLLVKKGWRAADGKLIQLGRGGELNPVQARAYILGDYDPRDHMGRFFRALGWLIQTVGFTNRLRSQRRLIVGSLIMRSDRHVVMDILTRKDERRLRVLAKQIYERLNISVMPNVQGDKPLVETIWHHDRAA